MIVVIVITVRTAITVITVIVATSNNRNKSNTIVVECCVRDYARMPDGGPPSLDGFRV